MIGSFSRHGQHPVTLVLSFVIVTLVLLVCVMMIAKLKGFDDDLNEDSPCATQVIAHSAIAGVSKELVAPGIVCPTRLVELESNDEDEVRTAIADEMLRCWNTWGKGELRLFGDKELAYCHVCSMINTPGTANVAGMPRFLDTRTAKNGQTYSALLQGKKSGEYFNDTDFKQYATAVMPTQPAVGVIFYYAKGQKWYDKLYNDIAGQPAVGATSGAVGGAVITVLVVGTVVSGGTTLVAAGVIGAASGAVGGLWYSIRGREDMSYMTLVVARPITKAEIDKLGCEYAPGSN